MFLYANGVVTHVSDLVFQTSIYMYLVMEVECGATTLGLGNFHVPLSCAHQFDII